MTTARNRARLAALTPEISTAAKTASQAAPAANLATDETMHRARSLSLEVNLRAIQDKTANSFLNK